MAEGGTVNVDVKVTGYWQTCPICTGCGSVPPDFYERIGAMTSTARTMCRRCTGTGTVVVPLAHHQEATVFVGDAAHPDWADYMATNLLDALGQVPDTGDWHGALRAWCERTMTGKLKPNRTAG